MKRPINVDDLITVTELAKELGVSSSTAGKMVQYLPVVQFGNTRVYERSLIQASLLGKNEKLIKFLRLDPSPDFDLDVLVPQASHE